LKPEILNKDNFFAFKIVLPELKELENKTLFNMSFSQIVIDSLNREK